MRVPHAPVARSARTGDIGHFAGPAPRRAFQGARWDLPRTASPRAPIQTETGLVAGVMEWAHPRRMTREVERDHEPELLAVVRLVYSATTFHFKFATNTPQATTVSFEGKGLKLYSYLDGEECYS